MFGFLSKDQNPINFGADSKGNLQVCSRKSNCVSSAEDEAKESKVALIEARGLSIDQIASAAKLANIQIVSKKDNYLYGTSTTHFFKFVDDIEILLKDGFLQVKSASRVGLKDFGVNRKRIEQLEAEVKKLKPE